MNEFEIQPVEAIAIKDLGVWRGIYEKEPRPDERVIVYFIRHAKPERPPSAKSYSETTNLSEEGKTKARQAGRDFAVLVNQEECVRLASNLMRRNENSMLEIEAGLKEKAGEKAKIYSRGAKRLLRGLEFTPKSPLREKMREADKISSGRGVDIWLMETDQREVERPQQMIERIKRLLRSLDGLAKISPEGPRSHFICVVNASVEGALASMTSGKTLAELGGSIGYLEPAKVSISSQEGENSILVFRGNRYEISL